MDSVSSGIAKELIHLNGRNFISSADFSSQQIKALLELASQLKAGNRRIDLGNRLLGLIFKKASTRTRVSFQVSMARLGGQVVDLSIQSSQIGRGEPVKDTARVLSRYCDVLAIRTFGHDELIDYANWASVPVINALTDQEHPCQALADLLTLKETFGTIEGLTLAYVGDGNNVANSLMILGGLLGVNIHLACPEGFEPLPEFLEKARSNALFGCSIKIFNDPYEAVSGAHALYTDVWASMGQEEEKMKRAIAFKDFTLNKDLLSKADNEAIILHCLPAHRGEEISDDVFESSQSRIFDQAENRLHAQQALLASLLGGL